MSSQAAVRTACALAAGRSLRNAVQRVKTAEELGYESVFVAQMAGRDSLTTLTAYATLTERIRVGTSIVPIYGRTPAVMAQAAVTLDEMSNGRVDLGLGVSHKESVKEWYGQDMDQPLKDMREYFTSVRAIVSGTPNDPGERWNSRFHLQGIEPRRDLRMYMAALSPGMLRLAGELADGVILWLCNPNYIAEVVVPEVSKGLAKSGRSIDDFDIVPVVSTGLTEDVTQVATTLRRELLMYLRMPFYRSMLIKSGFADDIAAFDSVADGEEAKLEAISEEYVNLIGAIGSEADIAASLARYRSAGATMPVVSPMAGCDTIATLEAAIKQ